MSDQECALYGELVRHLRDRCVNRLAELEPGQPETAREWIDGVIREWFFTPQDDLHGDAPRDVIWRERRGEPNVLSSDHQHEALFDDCPICQEMRGLEDVGEWHWCFDDGGSPLISEYDPQGWDAFWTEDVKESRPLDNEHDERGPNERDAPNTRFSVN